MFTPAVYKMMFNAVQTGRITQARWYAYTNRYLVRHFLSQPDVAVMLHRMAHAPQQ